MNDFIVTARHKCGSSILNRIIKSASFNKVCPYIIGPNDANNNQRKIHFYRKSREHQAHHESDKYVFILRNPLSICISSYYSFGYTHKKPLNLTEEEWSLAKTKIARRGLEGYIDDNIKKVSAEIEWFFNSEFQYKTFLPYELMISDFGRFLYDFLESINSLELYMPLFNRWAREFVPIDDRSGEIVSGNLKEHRRTSNINEWEEKIPQNKLKEYISNNPGLSNYIKWSNFVLNNKPL